MNWSRFFAEMGQLKLLWAGDGGQQFPLVDTDVGLGMDAPAFAA